MTRAIALGSCAVILSLPLTAATTHTVHKGETLGSIAAHFGISVPALVRANNLKDKDLVMAGRKLVIPAKSDSSIVEYTVRKGDSLADIATEYNLSVSELVTANHLSDPDTILPGQVLRIPTSKATYPHLPAKTLKALNRIHVKRKMWRYIVIHHSATPMGSGPAMDRYHRIHRHMENGLAYQFVIGNGHGMKDGAIYIGGRWRRQIEGGHLSVHALNLVSIGICLVGNLQKKPPTHAQMQSLEALVRYLLKVTDLPVSSVTTHRRIQPHHTLCPGKYFPYHEFVAELRH